MKESLPQVAAVVMCILAGAVMTHSACGQDLDKYRKILVSPTVNTPEPFKGFGGFCGWPKICRLHNGDLFVTFCAGYWHASWPTPLDCPPEYIEYLTQKYPWIAEWDAPDGGHMMWIRSRDNGKTWTRPRAFPVVPGAYAIGEVAQLSDGTMIAGAVIQDHYGWKIPAIPLEFARVVANRLPMKTVIFRSEDNGETWEEITRITGPFFAKMGHPHTFLEAHDGGLLLLTCGVPLPSGDSWNFGAQRYLSAILRSEDKGETWRTLSIFGSNDFNVEEGSAAYLPDGSIGTPSRPTSAWFQSYDHGRTWSEPRELIEGSGRRYKKGDLVVTPDGIAVLVFCGGPGGHGEVIYSRDSAQTWVKPAPDRGFKFDPLAYYPNACVLADGSIFAVGDHQGFQCEYGPYGAETVAMRFRIKSPEEGEGIELLPIDEE